MNRSTCLLSLIFSAFTLGVTGCASTYNPTPASTLMYRSGGHNRHAICTQLQQQLRQLGYTNSEVVSINDERAASVIVAYKANGCEK